MQIYASYEYHRAFVNAIRGSSLVDAEPFTDDMLDSPARWSGNRKSLVRIRKIAPFMMHQSIPSSFVMPHIQATEKTLADIYLRGTYLADYTGSIHVDVEIDDMSVRPICFPAYVYRIQHRGRSFYTFVNGTNLQCSGMRFYDWREIGIITAIGMAGVMTGVWQVLGWQVVEETNEIFWVSTVKIPMFY
ncbi:hypothetical protein BC937DRAFT_90406 [Endogone sp. FLAS-F59071]|nr:hypothetical protein BC937DRAFT_90406 [Endogone sp. FLAS-F59071]|eukprot:RUS17107.1 hypothetical protein BC937DRAFT_90406 [Endogone sp. FLAS-F59071]